MTTINQRTSFLKLFIKIIKKLAYFSSLYKMDFKEKYIPKTLPISTFLTWKTVNIPHRFNKNISMNES